MKILGMGVPELLIILVVILLIFGPKNLPKLGSALGKTVKNLREGMGAGEKDVEEMCIRDRSWPGRRRCASTAGVESGSNASRNGASSTGGKGEITVE